MKCSNLVTLGIMLTIISLTTGILASQINSVDAKLDSRNELVYSIPHLQNDILEIKSDLKIIREQLQQINFISYSEGL